LTSSSSGGKSPLMFGGQGRVPLVVREPIGMWRSSAALAFPIARGWYAHIPGRS
jgi:pyruvate dehydrogenase E1 component beta subunit